MNSLVNLIDINGTKITKEKDQIMNCSLEDMRQFSAKSIVEYIEYFNPNVLLAAFTSPISNVTYTIDGIKYNDTDRIAKYIDQLKTEEKKAIYDRFLDADVLYICFLDKNFVTKISSNKNLFNRIKDGLVAKICDNKYRYSNAIGDFMQYIRLRHDYDNKSRCMYINLALEVLESLNFDSLIEEIDKNGKKVTRFKDRGCENFLFYLLDIINISGIECLNLFAKKYVDNKSNLQKIIGFILKSDDSFITKDSCLGALFLIFPSRRRRTRSCPSGWIWTASCSGRPRRSRCCARRRAAGSPGCSWSPTAWRRISASKPARKYSGTRVRSAARLSGALPSAGRAGKSKCSCSAGRYPTACSCCGTAA